MGNQLARTERKRNKRISEMVAVFREVGPGEVLSMLGNGIIRAFDRIQIAELRDAALARLVEDDPDHYSDLEEDLQEAMQAIVKERTKEADGKSEASEESENETPPRSE